MSLDEFKCSWGPEGVDESASVTGIRSSDDGATATKNLITLRKDAPDFATKYAAFNWIYQTKNNGNIDGAWYMPAVNEILVLCNAGYTVGTAYFNTQLSAVGGASFPTDYTKGYFVSTEYDADNVNMVFFDIKSGFYGEDTKTPEPDRSVIYVRAISDFNQSN